MKLKYSKTRQQKEDYLEMKAWQNDFIIKHNRDIVNKRRRERRLNAPGIKDN